jgi:hypothetical protein
MQGYVRRHTRRRSSPFSMRQSGDERRQLPLSQRSRLQPSFGDMRREAVTLDCSGDGNAAGGLCVDGERATVTGFFQRTRPAAGAAAGGRC